MSYELTQDILKELLHYDSETGIFTWNKRDLKWFAHCEQPNGRCTWWNNKFASKKAGNIFYPKHCKDKPYNQIMITINADRRNWRATQLAWLYTLGYITNKPILRRNGNTLDDSWENLTLNYKETPPKTIDFSDGTKGEKIEITHELIKELLDYDKDTGILKWKYRDYKYFTHGKIPKLQYITWNKRYANKNVGSKMQTEDGLWYYSCKLTLKGQVKSYRVHRLIWFYMTGEIPDDSQIDHIDHNGLNNKWDNLRLVDNYGNQQNVSRRKDNTSGITGVYYNNTYNKWIASIQANKQSYSKTFNTFEDAVEQRKIWNIEFGFHENHGKMNNEII